MTKKPNFPGIQNNTFDKNNYKICNIPIRFYGQVDINENDYLFSKPILSKNYSQVLVDTILDNLTIIELQIPKSDFTTKSDVVIGLLHHLPMKNQNEIEIYNNDNQISNKKSFIGIDL